MIVDSLFIPSRMPAVNVDLTVPRWVASNGRDPCNEAMILMGREINCGLNHFSKYKIIETKYNKIIERIFLVEDHVEEPRGGLLGSYKTNLRCYPVTTKIHHVDAMGVIYGAEVFRHYNGIRAILARFTDRAMGSGLVSIHQAILAAIHSKAIERRSSFLMECLVRYASIRHHELSSLCSADDALTDVLTGNIHLIVEEAFHVEYCYVPSEIELATELISDLVRVPVPDRHDELTRYLMHNEYIDSNTMRAFIGYPYNQRPIAHHQEDLVQYAKLPHNVQYTVPQDALWAITPFINRLEALPYSDITIEFGEGKAYIVNASSVLAPVTRTDALAQYQDHSLFSSSSQKLIDLKSALPVHIRQIVAGLRLPICPVAVECTITKNFMDEVYIEFRGPDGRKYSYFFDTNVIALGTRGIISMNTSELFGQFRHFIMPESLYR